MKKKIILILIFLILIFIISNYKVFLWSFYFFEANNKYKVNLFTWALHWYNNTLKYLSLSHLNYNLWNTYYKIWENEDNLDFKIKNFRKSINYYSWILNDDFINNKEEDKDIRFNYEFVKNKLDKLLKQEENNPKDNSEDDSENNSEENNSDNSSDKANKSNIDNITDESKKINKWTWEQDNTSVLEKEVELSSEELKQIDDYIDKLKNEEINNRQFYNNLENYLDNSFFDNIFDRWWEKDW